MRYIMVIKMIVFSTAIEEVTRLMGFNALNLSKLRVYATSQQAQSIVDSSVVT